MMFQDRTDAGEQLAKQLGAYHNHSDTVILGLPRGGVVTAYEVASALNLPLDIVCPRKIGAPMNPEFAIGAITETGEGIFNEEVIARLNIPQSYLKKAIAEEKLRAEQRLKIFRSGYPPISLKDKTVILIDDGLATGSTMHAAIKSVRAFKPVKVVVAVPVSPINTAEEIRNLVDEFICLDTPSFFQAVGQFYDFFDQTSDEEVIELMKLAHKE